MTMLGQTVGFPVPEGGAGRLSRGARAGGSRSPAGRSACDREVTRVDRRGRPGHGRRDRRRRLAISAARAVVADVGCAAPLRTLWSHADDLPRRVVSGMKQLPARPRHGQGRLGALRTGPVGHAAGVRPRHLPRRRLRRPDVRGPRPGDAQAIPAEPFLLAGQMTTTDPSRSPAGTESMWAYTHVPQPHPAVRDAGDGSVRGTWDHDDCERFADRMQARIERLAPGFGSPDPGPPGARPARAARRATPTWSAAPSTAAPSSSSSSWSSDRCRGCSAAPRPGIARPLPRLRLGPPRWRRPRRSGQQRRPGGALPRPVRPPPLASVAS